ncbi:acyltransferase family protein, partial [Acinetobacter baumannii]
RTWGVGAPNGSLWTIAVEIQFYILVPLLVYLIKKWKNKFLYLISAFVIVMSISLYAGHLLKVIGEDKWSGKLLHVS